MSRSPPPPLPGGYKLGEKVFYTGASKTVSTGDKLVHGQQGEVTGPATAEGYIGKGVRVLFPGNKESINCYLTSVRRLRAAPAATPACALHTRRCAQAPSTRSRQPQPRRPNPQREHSRVRRGLAPERGRAKPHPLRLLLVARR